MHKVYIMRCTFTQQSHLPLTSKVKPIILHQFEGPECRELGQTAHTSLLVARSFSLPSQDVTRRLQGILGVNDQAEILPSIVVG